MGDHAGVPASARPAAWPRNDRRAACGGRARPSRAVRASRAMRCTRWMSELRAMRAHRAQSRRGPQQRPAAGPRAEGAHGIMPRSLRRNLRMSLRRKFLGSSRSSLVAVVAGCKVNSINYFPPHPASVRVMNLMMDGTTIDRAGGRRHRIQQRGPGDGHRVPELQQRDDVVRGVPERQHDADLVFQHPARRRAAVHARGLRHRGQCRSARWSPRWRRRRPTATSSSRCSTRRSQPAPRSTSTSTRPAPTSARSTRTTRT